MTLLAGAALCAMTGVAAASVQTGYIAITDASTNASLGWVGNTLNPYGEYVATMDVTDRLLISFDDASTPFALQVSTVAAPYAWLGAVQGFSNTDVNLGVGNSNYAILAGATLTNPNATPNPQDNTFTDAVGIPEAVETSIWSQPGTTLPQLTPQWVNADNFLPATSTLLSGDVLVLTGDPTAFVGDYGPATLAALTLVPTVQDFPPSPVPAPASLAVLCSGLLGLFTARRRP